jgi:hypothetical protein
MRCTYWIYSFLPTRLNLLATTTSDNVVVINFQRSLYILTYFLSYVTTGVGEPRRRRRRFFSGTLELGERVSLDSRPDWSTDLGAVLPRTRNRIGPSRSIPSWHRIGRQMTGRSLSVPLTLIGSFGSDPVTPAPPSKARSFPPKRCVSIFYSVLHITKEK